MKIQAIMYVLNFILCANYMYNLYIDSLLVMVNSSQFYHLNTVMMCA